MLINASMPGNLTCLSEIFCLLPFTCETSEFQKKISYSEFMDIDKEKLTALLGVLRSLKQADDENKTGTFKVVISILYKYCSTLSGTPEVGDYDKVSLTYLML